MDSTSKTVEILENRSSKRFWEEIKKLREDRKKPNWEHILASDTPIWMYTLARIAHTNKKPLNKDFFQFVAPKIKLYPNVKKFLKTIKNIEENSSFKKQKIKIYHFIISAGLKDLIDCIFTTKELIEWTFGGRYTVIYSDEKTINEPESIPAFCMDETMKTRSIFEIAKGTFDDPKTPVNKRVSSDQLKFPFFNMIYVGDGPTDIPSLSLVRSKGGVGVVVYNKEKPSKEVKRKLKDMSLDRRANLITSADFSLKGELFQFIEAHCHRVLKACEASNIKSLL